MKTIEILRNATIVYIDGVRERYDAIHVTDKKIVTGRVFKTDGNEKFGAYGFISRRNVKQIYDGSKKKIPKMEL